jgi:hypothetical protein
MPENDLYPDRDLLIGGEAICDYINPLIGPGSRVTTSTVYAWIERSHLDVKRIGSRIVASKQAIRRRLMPAGG